MVHISVLKIAEIGALDGKILISAILEIRGLFLTENSRKSEGGGSHLSHTDIIFNQLGENHLKCSLAFHKRVLT